MTLNISFFMIQHSYKENVAVLITPKYFLLRDIIHTQKMLSHLSISFFMIQHSYKENANYTSCFYHT